MAELQQKANRTLIKQVSTEMAEYKMINGKMLITKVVQKKEVTQNQIDLAKLEYMKDQVFYSRFADMF